MSTNNRFLGVLLDRGRVHKGWSVARVAKQAHVPLSVTQKVLSGQALRPSWWVIQALAHAVDVPVSYLDAQLWNTAGPSGITPEERAADAIQRATALLAPPE